MAQHDVLIVGGGLTGATLASALSDGARRILVLEARAGKNPRFAGELIHPTGVAVLDEHRLLEPLRRAGGVAVRGFAVMRGAEAQPTLLPYSEIPGGHAHGLAMEHHEMVSLLRAEASSRPGVEVRTGARVTELLRDGQRVVGVRTDEGVEHRASLTLVAEGRHSKLRDALGIAEESRLISYTAAVLVEGTTLPAERFGHIFLGAPGPILAYPILESSPPGQDGATIRMCLDIPELPEGKRGTAAVASLLRERYASFLPEPLRGGMLRSLDARPPEMAANYAIYTRRCVAAGAALVGESGGCSHPLTASGMTVCLNDVRSLREELLSDPSSPVELDAALDRYQSRRYRFVRAREVLADALYEVFRGDEPGTRAIREGIFQYWDGSLRARASSMALLSGADSRLSTFLAEYWRVVGHGLERSAKGEVPGNLPSLLGRYDGLRGLVEKSVEKLGTVAAHVRAGTMS